MKHTLFILLVILSFTSCKKEHEDGRVEPPDTRIISSDTLTSGQKWGVAIGDNSSSVYTVLQSIKVERRITYLAIVGNIFTKIEDLQGRIPLYTSLFLDETIGTNSGIQIYFENNKVKAVWTNGGTRLTRWPANMDINTSIGEKDLIGDIYQKLVNIKNTGAYSNKFQRMSLFPKDIDKMYDPQMSLSPQWYFAVPVDDKRFNLIELNFSSDILVSIYSTLFEKQ